MRSLDTALQACQRFHPGLGEALAGLTLAEREAPGSPVIELFRKFDGVGLVVPREFGGAAATALESVQVMRGLSSYSPSLGAAVCMHHFTAAMLYSLAGTVDRLSPAQVDMLNKVVTDGLLMASGWSEGKTSQNILVPSVTAEPDGADWVLNGSKKPCSLSRSMDLLTASVTVVEDGKPTLALALVPASTEGISVRPFWNNPVLAGAESDEIVLQNVRVPDALVIRTQPDDPHRLDDLQSAGFVWFVLLITSVYTGAASAVCAQLLKQGKGSVTDRAAVLIALESAVSQLEGVARAVDAGLTGDDAVAAVLVSRYAAQTALTAAIDLGVELLGGMAFIGSGDVGYLSSAVRALAFHPPSRTSASEPLLDYFAGNALTLS